MARKFPKKVAQAPEKPYARSWAVCGVDVSMTSMSGIATAYDAILDKLRGPGVFSVRWERDIHFLDRLAQATRSGDFIHTLLADCGPFSIPPENVWIAVEEAWPVGLVHKADSMWLRQQAQIQGCFVGGLIRAGFHRVHEANNQLWKNPIRQETGIGRPDKWAVKEWAIQAYGLPDLPDLIDHSKRGLIPRPDTSKAKARQPDDIYDAAGIHAWMDNEREMEVLNN